jgi:hypothetical protein
VAVRGGYLQCSFRSYRLLAILLNLPRNSCQYNVMVAHLPQNHRDIAAKQNRDQILRNDFQPCLAESSSGLTYCKSPGSQRDYGYNCNFYEVKLLH